MNISLLRFFLTIIEPTNIMLVVLGLLVGIFLGALPGIGVYDLY